MTALKASSRKDLPPFRHTDFVLLHLPDSSMALRYGRGLKAPLILAKGTGRRTRRILDQAAQVGIAVVRKRKLETRLACLFSHSRAGHLLPMAFWASVIDIMRTVYRRDRERYRKAWNLELKRRRSA